jgi:hypothetical protein
MLFDTDRNKSQDAVMKSAHYSFTLKSYTGETIFFPHKDNKSVCVLLNITLIAQKFRRFCTHGRKVFLWFLYIEYLSMDSFIQSGQVQGECVWKCHNAFLCSFLHYKLAVKHWTVPKDIEWSSPPLTFGYNVG